MMQTRVHFGAGLFLGVVVCTLFFHFFAPRYEVIKSESGVVRQDKWTGNSWQHEGNSWKKIPEDTRDWQPVDKALMNALNMQEKTGTSESYANTRLNALKNKYSVLESLSDEEIMERIKYLYARKIIVDLYMSQMEIQ